MVVPRGVEVFELFNERMKENSDKGHDNDEEEKKSHRKWDGEFEGIPRVAEEVVTPLLLWKLPWEAKRERAMAIKPLSKR